MLNIDLPKHIANVEGPTFTGDEDFSSLFGIAIGKKAKARVAARKAVRQEKKATKRQLKKEKKQAKIDLKKARAQAKIIRAQNGTGGIGGFLSGIFGGGQQEEEVYDDGAMIQESTPMGSMPGLPVGMPASLPGGPIFSTGFVPDDSVGRNNEYEEEGDDDKKWYQNPLVIVGGVVGFLVLGFVVYLVAKK